VGYKNDRRAVRGGLLATIASLASLIAALTCCLPIGTLLMAAGSATASIVSEKLRPWLLALSIVSLLIAFLQTYYWRRCSFTHRRVRTALLWFSAIVVSSMVTAPRLTSTILAGRLPSFSGVSSLRDFQERYFVSEFNADPNETRLVLLLSPT
jgi:hypothetical protein